MTIEEAIEILKLDVEGSISITQAQHQKARKLGIEALKGIRNARALDPKLILAPLSGETRESETKSPS